MIPRPRSGANSLPVLAAALCVGVLCCGTANAVTLTPDNTVYTISASDQVSNFSGNGSLTAANLKATKTFNYTLSSPTFPATVIESVYQYTLGGVGGVMHTTFVYAITNTDPTRALHNLSLSEYPLLNVALYYSGTMPANAYLSDSGTVSVEYPPAGIPKNGGTSTVYLDYTGGVGFYYNPDAQVSVRDGGTHVLNGAYVPTPEPATMLGAVLAGVPLVGGAALRRWRSKKANS